MAGGTVTDERLSPVWQRPRVISRVVPLTRFPFAWAVIAFMLVIDVIWCARIGLSVGGLWKTTGALGVLLTLSLAYRHRGGGIASVAEAGAVWTGFTTTGCVLTYLCAACSGPLQDAWLSGLDRAIGFDWIAWREIVFTRPVLHWALYLAYVSLLPQFLLSMLLPAMGRADRFRELFRLAALTLLWTAVISAVCPALGPFAAVSPGQAEYLPDVLALRAGGPWQFNLPAMHGIVTMPSYHTALALLFTYAFRRTGALGWAVAVLNLAMLLAIPPIGGHYLVDMIVQVVGVALCLPVSRWLGSIQRRGVASIDPGIGVLALASPAEPRDGRREAAYPG